MLRPRHLVPAKHDAGIPQRLADHVAPGRRHVVIQRAVDEGELALDVRCARERVVGRVGERAGVHVRGEVADGGGDAGVQGGAVCEMPAETHACGTDAAGAGGEGEEVGDCEGGVFVVGREGLDGAVVSEMDSWEDEGELWRGGGAVLCFAMLCFASSALLCEKRAGEVQSFAAVGEAMLFSAK